jgi:crotonobetainyl-CoA:carnitine CoA-transferase CaiB-like acyl-CoA transferase
VLCCSDIGVEVLRVDRVVPSNLSIPKARKFDLLNRGRRSFAVDLRKKEGAKIVPRIAEKADGKYISVGSIEPKSYAQLLRLTGLEGKELPGQMDRSKWSEMKEIFQTLFKSKTRDEWDKIMEGTDACFAPVLSMVEALLHDHNLSPAHSSKSMESSRLLLRHVLAAPKLRSRVRQLNRAKIRMQYCKTGRFLL